MRRKKRSELGVGKVTFIVFGMIAAAVVYSGFKLIPFFYCYYDTQAQFETMVRLAGSETDAWIRDRLWHDIRKSGIPVRPEDLKIHRDAATMRISLRYREIFYIPWRGKDYVIWEFPFYAHAEGSYQ